MASPNGTPINQFNPDTLPYNDPRSERRVAIVTGASAGLGLYTALHLYIHGWIVYMGARNQAKVEQAREFILQEAQKRLSSLPSNARFGSLVLLDVDFTSFESVENAVRDYSYKESSLDLLVNNAGIMAQPLTTTSDGYEIQLQTNHMGPFLFTQLLIPKLQRSSLGPNHPPRIVFLSSIGHYMVPYTTLDLDDNYEHFPDKLWTWFRYGKSKTANIHTAKMLSIKYPEILTVAVHPGFALQTSLLDHWKALPLLGTFFSISIAVINRVIGVNTEKGAYNSIYAALSPNLSLEKDNGKYFVPVGIEQSPSQIASDTQQIQKTWDWTVEQLNKGGFLNGGPVSSI